MSLVNQKCNLRMKKFWWQYRYHSFILPQQWMLRQPFQISWNQRIHLGKSFHLVRIPLDQVSQVGPLLCLKDDLGPRLNGFVLLGPFLMNFSLIQLQIILIHLLRIMISSLNWFLIPLQWDYIWWLVSKSNFEFLVYFLRNVLPHVS